MAVKAKVLEYAVGVDDNGLMTVPGGGEFVPPDGWTADHLLLAALVRCSIDGFAYHARRAGHSVVASGSSQGTVTRTEVDGRYRFVDISVQIDARLTPHADDSSELILKAERDCFVGASLSVKPEYAWRVS